MTGEINSPGDLVKRAGGEDKVVEFIMAEVKRAGSVLRAAANLGYAPSALTYHLKKAKKRAVTRHVAVVEFEDITN